MNIHFEFRQNRWLDSEVGTSGTSFMIIDVDFKYFG